MYYQGYRPPAQPVQPPSGGKKPDSPQRYRRKKRHPLLWLSLAVVIAVGAWAAQRVQARQQLEAEVNAVSQVYLQNIYVDGIHIGGMTPQQAIDAVVAAVNERQSSWSLRLTYQGTEFASLNYASMGMTTDISEVYSLLREAYALGHTGTTEAKKKDIDALKAQPRQLYTSQSELTDEKISQLLLNIQQVFERAPTDAYLAYFYPDYDDPFGIQAESSGMHLDIEPVRQQIMQMAADGQSGDLELQPDILAPAVTTEDIRRQVALRAEAITPVSKQSTTARTDNIRVAFSKYNGKIVAAGESISFNKTVGYRTLKNGFQYAIEYANGFSEMGIGGGVCQASTTIYLAALRSEMEIVERESHADQVSYTTFGQDATVSYVRGGSNIDFVFKNNSDGPIYITAHVEASGKNSYQCVVRIYGQSMGENVSYKLRTQTVETLPAPVTAEYRQDTKGEYVTYKDEEPYLYRKARDGFVNETYLQRWENGNLVSETLVSRDTCKARSTVYLTGTKNR